MSEHAWTKGEEEEESIAALLLLCHTWGEAEVANEILLRKNRGYIYGQLRNVAVLECICTDSSHCCSV